jgi:hypothetical protein
MSVNESSSNTTELAWSEPQWSYRPRVKAELSSVLDWKMWSRVLVLVVLVTVVAAHYIRKVFPDLEFNWVRALAFSLAVLAVQLVMFGSLLWTVPPRITINRKGISRQHGQSVRWRVAKNIRLVAIDATNTAHPNLRVEAAGRKTWNIGIASEIDLTQLHRFLREVLPDVLINEKRLQGLR